MRRTLAVFVIVILAGFLTAQTAAPTRDLVLENEFVRIFRVTIPPGGKFDLHESRDTVALRLQDETATFIPRGSQSRRDNPSNHNVTDLLIVLATHWDPEVHACAEPMKCTHETKMGGEILTTTTTLFTNGFLTAATHKAVPGGTLNSSYYSARGIDHIVFVPFTDLQANFGGIDESLKTGQPYFSAATEVEVTAKNAEARWFVLRINSPAASK